ncbi:MAG: hypothetical protein RLZZ628_280 [Bacteroidota bacterium]|jgi:hypothetical protein
MDLKKEALALLHYHECETVKFVSILPSSRIMAQLISAFANTKGGYIILGVDSDKRVIGLSQDSRVNTIMENSLNSLSTLPNMQQQYVLYEGKQLYAIRIEKSETLILVENMVYKRIGTTVISEKSVQPIISEKKEPTKQKILFLAASPKNEKWLHLDKEYKTIKDKLHNSPHLELLLPEFSLTIDSFLSAMNQAPQIVHFSGHGQYNGITITNDKNYSEVMSTKTLEMLFEQYEGNIKLVVLNACYSEAQAKVISKFGMYVIGMTNTIKDNVAIDFASGLYLGLGLGKNIQGAYNYSKILLNHKHSNFTDLPKVWKNEKRLDWAN